MSEIFHSAHQPSRKPKTDPVRLFGEKKMLKQANRIVLVMVDDDEDDCYLVEAALKDACCDCTFRCVHDGQEIMDYLNRSGNFRDPKSAPLPDIILLDLNMPKMSGQQVLGELKTDSRFRSIPVIVLTTSANVDDVKACYSLGANSYVLKQATYEGLRTSIETIKGYWLEIATLPPKNE